VIGVSNNYGSSWCVHLVTNQARCLRYDDDDEDYYYYYYYYDYDTQIGPKETFKNPLLKLLYFVVRQKRRIFSKCVFERKIFRNLFSQNPAKKFILR
jgi:hypothetical protein